MLHSLDRIYDASLALVYPQPCAICGRNVESRHDGVACARCWQGTYFFRDDDQFTMARACGSYEGALRASILELKRQPRAPFRLARLMFEVQSRDPLNSAEVIEI